MNSALQYIVTFFNSGIFIYSLLLITGYIILAILSARETFKYVRKNSFVNYRSILSSPIAPPISILAPAYNEDKTIVENVRSLLSLHYNFFEVIIINDGSKDNSLDILIEAYSLEKVDFAVNLQIGHKPILGVYKSTNPAFKKLTIVDKVNGGKADALNVGINIAQHDLFVAIDVDCIIEEDALLKLVKPFLDNGECRVIATGGVVRIANSCEVENGRLVKVHLPENLLPRFQTLEYIRSFLLGRMAWSTLDGLLIISGAFGMFDRKIAIACGGYLHHTVGEDMELVVRMRRYMHDHDMPYKVDYIPDPLCWTEAPESIKVFGRQRNRWTRGNAETLWFHRSMFFNKNYKVMGMLSLPYWFFFEYLAPIIEAVGILYFLLLVILGSINWPFFWVLLGMVYVFSLLLSTVALLSEEFSYHQYKRNRDLVKLFALALIEPILFQPLCTIFALQGHWDLLMRKKQVWGEMSRSGFVNKPGAK